MRPPSSTRPSLCSPLPRFLFDALPLRRDPRLRRDPPSANLSLAPSSTLSLFNTTSLLDATLPVQFSP
eukprot:365951-Rhodomonas_salina.1